MLLDGQAARLLTELTPAPGHAGEVLAGLHVVRGLAQMSLGQADAARASFALALVAVPDSTEALLGEARLDYAAGQGAAATARVERVLLKTPRLAEAWLFKGELLQAGGHYDAALQAYAQAEPLLPRSVLPRLAAARILIEMGRGDAAQERLDLVLRLAPNHAAANYTQALLHFQNRNYGPAQAAVEATLRLVPDHAPALLLLAGTQLAQGAVQKAQQRFLQVLQAAPDDLLARKLVVAAALQMNEPAPALLALAPVQALMAADADLLALAGQAHMQARDFDRAQGYLERAAALQADPTGERVRLGLNQLSRGEPARGIAELQRAAGLDPAGTRADFVLALSHLRRREFDAALHAARQLQAKQPSNPIAFNLAGAALVGLDDLAGARTSFERALVLDAGYRPAAINLALVDLRTGRSDSARQRLQAVQAQAPGNVDAIAALARLDAAPGALVQRLQRARTADAQAVPVRLLLARELLSGADTDGALAAALEANAIAPDSVLTLDALGAAQEAAGRKQDAVLSYEKLVRLTAGQVGSAGAAEARYRLARACAAAELWSRAEEEYRRVIGLRPDHAGALLDLARLHAARGQFAQATRIAADLQARLPRSGSGQALLGDLLARQQRYADAAAAYGAAFAIAPQGALLVKQHGAAQQAGGRAAPGGLLPLQQWLASHPDDTPTRQYLADQQLAAGSAAAAIENYEKVLAASPRNAFALNNLAQAWQARGDPRALQAAEAAYRLRPEHPQIADTLGWLLVQSAQSQLWPRGLRLLQQAAEDLEQSPDIGLHLAVALAKTGDKPGARALVKRRLDLGQDIRLDPQSRALLQGS
jgi:putative PEP-CTERM system TPR-repeat lipoprotein